MLDIFIFASRQLRVIRAFRSTLEDLNERRSIHSLHSLRSPRTVNIPYGTGSSQLYNSNLLSPNYKNLTQSLQQQRLLRHNPLQLPVDMIYIDEDPTTQKYQKRNGSNGSDRLTSATLTSAADQCGGQSLQTLNTDVTHSKTSISPLSSKTKQTETRI